MKKFLKIAAAIVAVLLVLMVVLVVLAQLLITPERVRTHILPRVETALQRDITLDEIEVSVFTGITLGGLVILEKDGTEPFVAAEGLVLQYKLWPLLLRRVVIDEARLESPRIRIERFADGSFNFSDMVRREAAEEGVRPTPDETDGPPMDLLVSEIVLTNGELILIDHQTGSPPFRLQATELELAAEDISLQEPFPFRLGARVAEGTLTASGEINPETAAGEAQVKISGLELAQFAPYLVDAVPARIDALRLEVDLTAKGGADAIRTQGQVTLAPITLQMAREGEEPVVLRDASLSLDYTAAVDQKAEIIEIEQGTVIFNGIQLQISGRVENYAVTPTVDLQANLPPLEIAAALAALPPELVDAAAEFQPSGEVSARLHLAGTTAEPMRLLQEGEIQLSPVEVTAGGARVALSGAIRMAGDALQSENLQMSMGENRADIDLQAEDLFGDIIRVRSAIRAKRFALDPLLQASAAGPTAAGETQEADPQPVEPLDLPVTAEGTVAIGETVYKGLTVHDFDLQYRLEKNIFTVQRLNGKVAGGTIGGTGKVDLGQTDPIYESSLNLQGIQADPLISALWPQAAGTVFGTMQARLTLAGQGTEPAVLRRNLSGKGDLRLADGQLTGAGLLQGLADFLKLDELRVLRFSQAKGSFTVRQGKMQVDSDIDGKNVRLQPKGTIDLEKFSLDLALNLRLAPELVQRSDLGKVASLLTDEQGWAQVPLKVAGTLERPRFALETAALKERAGEQLKGRLQQELQKRLPQEETQDGDRPSGREPIEDAIRGLFR